MRQWQRTPGGVYVQATSPTIQVVSPDPNPPATTTDFAPVLVTMPNVELLEVGENWETSTGDFTWDVEDLRAAVESQQDPGVRSPIIKLGHVDSRFNAPKPKDGTQATVQDGQPALGQIQNLRTVNNEQTLVGDFVAMPQWLAAVMYSAYPRRSIEGWFDWESRSGNEWPFVLTACALLGEYYPAITTLEDIRALWGSEPPKLYPVEEDDEIYCTSKHGSSTLIRARRSTDVKWRKQQTEAAAAAPAEVQASVSIDNVVSAYYDSLGPGQDWWWVRQVLASPLQLIVDTDDGNLLQVNVTVDGDDNVTFDEGTVVKVEYVAAAGLPQVRQHGQIIAASYAQATETGREVRSSAEQTDEVPTPEQEEERTMLTAEALQRLGLSADATEDQINAAILAQINSGGDGGEGEGGEGDGGVTTQPETQPTEPQAQPTPAPATTPGTTGDQPAETPTSQIPAGMVLVDEAAWDEVRQGVAASNAEREERQRERRDQFISAAARDGKFPAARIAHYTAMWDLDPEGTKAAIESLASGLVPIAARGHEGGPTDDKQRAEAAAYPAGWKPKVAASRKNTSSSVKVVSD